MQFSPLRIGRISRAQIVRRHDLDQPQTLVRNHQIRTYVSKKHRSIEAVKLLSIRDAQDIQ